MSKGWWMKVLGDQLYREFNIDKINTSPLSAEEKLALESSLQATNLTVGLQKIVLPPIKI